MLQLGKLGRRLQLLVFYFWAAIGLVEAQVSIQYPQPAQSLSVGGGAGSLQFRVSFSGACDSVYLKVAFPQGVLYVDSSLTLDSGQHVFSVQNIGSSEAPIFYIGTVDTAKAMIFRLNRRALCNAASQGKDSVLVSGLCGTVSELNPNLNAYNILLPSLSLSNPALISDALPNRVYTRNFNIINGGVGCVDTLRFRIIYPGGLVRVEDSLQVAGRRFAPEMVHGDTLFYRIFGVFGADGLFCNGESVALQESFRLLGCALPTRYMLGYGHDDTLFCLDVQASGAINMRTGLGDLGVFSLRLDNGYIDMCGTGTNGYNRLYANWRWQGSGDFTAAAAYDVNLRVGGYSFSSFLLPLQNGLYAVIDSVLLGDSLIASTFDASFLRIDFKDLYDYDPDGPGGLDDLDGDGYYDDLLPGSVLNLSFRIKLNCSNSCNQTVSYHAGLAGDIEYRGMCDTSRKSSRSINGFLWAEYGFAGNSYIPSNIVDGQPFRIRLSTGATTSGNFYRSNQTRWQWRLILPPGVSMLGNAQWFPGFYFSPNATGVSVSYSQLGDTAIIQSPNNGVGWVEFDLRYDCVGGGNINNVQLHYELLQINNIQTGCACFGRMLCDVLSTRAYCDTGCVEGLINGAPVVSRSIGSLGYTDLSLNTRQSIDSISAYDLSKALVFDTLIMAGYAIQKDTAQALGLWVELPQNWFFANKLNPFYGEFALFRNDTLLWSDTGILFDASPTSAGIQRINWDLTPYLNGIDLLPGDSVTSKTYYTVANDDLPQTDEQSGLAWYFYNSDGMGGRRRCNERIPEMYLVGTSRINGSNLYVASGCTEVSLGGMANYLARRFAFNGVPYLQEFRPMVYIDSVVLIMPAGYEFTRAGFYHSGGFGSTATNSINLQPDVTNGNRLTFYNPGTWPPLDLRVANDYSAYFQVFVKSRCETAAQELITQEIYIKDYYYAFKDLPQYPSVHQGNLMGKTNPIILENRALLQLTNLSGEVEAAKTSESWQMRITNNALGAASFIWVAVPQHPNITINSITRVADGTILTPEPYSSGLWYRISAAGLAPFASLDLRLDFSYQGCQPDSLRVLAGWDCQAYPANPDSFNCSISAQYFKYLPIASRVQVSYLGAAPAPVTLCNTDTLQFEVNSAFRADLTNPEIEFELPVGFGIPSDSLMVEYPSGSGNIQTIPAVLTGNFFRAALHKHSAIDSMGIAGTDRSLAADVRSAKVLLPYQVNCDFLSGQGLRARAYGAQPCGNPALNNGASTISPGIFIEGTTNSGAVGIQLQLSDTASSCGSGITLTVRLKANSQSFKYGDTLIMNFPAFLKPDTQSFASVFQCSQCVPLYNLLPDGSLLMKVLVDSNLAESEEQAFSIFLKQDEILTGSFQLEAIVKRRVQGLSCNGLVCDNTAVIVGSAISDSLLVEKPPVYAAFNATQGNACLNTQSLTVYSLSFNPSGNITRHQWLSGDGRSFTDSARNDIQWAAHGQYLLQLVVEGENGCTDTASQMIDIRDQPKANLLLSNTAACLRQNSFLLTDASTVSNAQLSRFWELGSGDTSNAATFSYSFAQAGTFYIKLTSISEYGCLDTTSTSVVVWPMPAARFSINDSLQCFNQHLLLLQNNSNISNGTLSYRWLFGDGNSDSTINTLHQYSQHGIYHLQLIASSNQLCIDTAQVQVEIYPSPNASFQLSDSGLCFRNHQLSASNQSSIPYHYMSYTWHFGNGQTDTAANPIWQYAQHGLYNITLVVESEKACTDTAYASAELWPMPMASFALADSTQCFNTQLFEGQNQSSIPYHQLRYQWLLGNGDADTNTQLLYQYPNVGHYTISLISTSEKNCADTFSIPIEVFPAPEAAFLLSDTATCFRGHQISTTNNTQIAYHGLEYLWRFGNGNTDTAAAPSFTYNSHGVYTVSLVAISEKQCRDTANQVVEIFPMPIAAFQPVDSALCFRDHEFEFRNQSSIPYHQLQYSWSFGDGNTDTLRNPVYSYQSHGLNQVQLIVISEKQCRDTTQLEVEVYPMPTADFTLSDTALCFRDHQFFLGNQSSIPYHQLSYNWHFGNGSSDTATNTQIVYPQQGIYQVSLVAESEKRCSDTAIKTLEVYPMPLAQFSLNDSTPCFRNHQLILQNQSSIPYHQLSANWQFGDGNSDSDYHTRHQYLTHGVYQIQLISSSEKRCHDTLVKTVEVYPMPIAHFEVNDSAFCLRQHQFQFSNQSSIPYHQLDYRWYFGDGAQVSDTNPAYSYATHGVYTAQLIAESEKQCRDTMQKTLEVYPMPIADFSIDNQGQCLSGNRFQFNNTGSIPYHQLRAYWSLSNGDSATGDTLVYSYPTYGSYQVRLILESEKNCRDTSFKQVDVFPQPQLRFSVSDSAQCYLNNRFTFVNQTTIPYSQITHLWNFGDSITSTAASPVHAYQYDGLFRVQLITRTEFGCVDSLFTMVEVYPMPQADFTTDSVCFSEENSFTSTSLLSKGRIQQYKWQLGDGTQRADSSFTHTYIRPGIYNVQLIIGSEAGCFDTLIKPQAARVYPLPQPKFSFAKLLDSFDVTGYQFTDSSQGSFPLNYRWQFSDGQQFTDASPWVLFTDTGLISLKLQLLDPFGCVADTNANLINYPYNTPHIPNAFTPNADRLNEGFKIEGVAYARSFKLSIYNRWGQKIYETNNLTDAWDGRYQDAPVPQDVYVYVLSYVNLQNELITRKGSITLLR